MRASRDDMESISHKRPLRESQRRTDRRWGHEYHLGLFDIDIANLGRLALAHRDKEQNWHLRHLCDRFNVRSLRRPALVLLSANNTPTRSALVSSIGRLIYTVQVVWTTDSTYLIAQLALWTFVTPNIYYHIQANVNISVAEPGSIILCTCFPLMPRFLKIVRNQALKITTSSSRRVKPAEEYSNKNIETVAFTPAACEECRDNVSCASHRDLDSTTVWHGNGVGSSGKPFDMDRGIHRTVSIELTTQKASTRNWV